MGNIYIYNKKLWTLKEEDLLITREETCHIIDSAMVKVLECQRCKTELGTERNISIKSQLMLEVTSGISDQMPLKNGHSISFMEVLVNSSSKDGSLILVSESGLDSHGYQLPSTLLDH